MIPQIINSQVHPETKGQPEKNGQITQPAQLLGTQESPSNSISMHPTTRKDNQSKETILFHQYKTKSIIINITPSKFQKWV